MGNPIQTSQPLAERLRPHTLDEMVGQAHLVGEGKPLRLALQGGRVPSMILWGPPGVGKTTVARLIAGHVNKPFYALSAVSAGKNDLRAVVEDAKSAPSLLDDPDIEPGAILFLDEIHRFNKAQQDFLLPYVEDGTITLIGATTENPSFEVISALLSRVQVFTLRSLSEDDLRQIVVRGAEELSVSLSDEAAEFLSQYANGDARAALTLLENTAKLYASDNDAPITLENVKDALQSRHLRYDKTGEEHYNTISAFIKSMRASDVDAALYYLARMLDAGEDPKFIARRMVIFASEDIGMALPTALVVANEVFRAVETIGLPEAQYNLAHGVTYLASAQKDRSAGDAYWAAVDDVKRHGNLPVPMHLRNAPTKLMKEMGYGKREQQGNLPEKLSKRRYYRPKGK
ncbi:MAG: AAA family ATPase [Anaerolineaceae bacterium]|nr:AAA family ATPase [Anaerolineaceae bacterium]